MTRRFALACAALVSLGVFSWLAGPLLESQFGVEALIATYGGLALATGGMTYALVRRFERSPGRRSTIDSAGTDVTITVEDAQIDREMEQLKDE